MHKELILSIIIIVFIIGLNTITEKNTDKTVKTVSTNLEIVRQDILKKEAKKEEIQTHLNDAYNKWEELDDIMAYYIEHDELEKVKTALTSARSFIEVEEYEQSIESIDKCIYILEHIQEREKLSLDNIF